MLPKSLTGSTSASVLASAFAVLFLFWSIVLFGRKMMKVKTIEELTSDKTWVLMGAGIVGALLLYLL